MAMSVEDADNMVPVGVLLGMFFGLGTLTLDMSPFLMGLILMTFIKYSNL